MDDYSLTKDGVLIDSSNDLQLMALTDRRLVISQVVLTSMNKSYFQGTFRCTVRDGISRVSVATININGKCKRSGVENIFKFPLN